MSQIRLPLIEFTGSGFQEQKIIKFPLVFDVYDKIHTLVFKILAFMLN